LLYCSAHPLGVDDDLKIIGVRSGLWWAWTSEKADKEKFAFVRFLLVLGSTDAGWYELV